MAAIQQIRSPRQLVAAAEDVPAAPAWIDAGRRVRLPAPLRLPAKAISAEGSIDLRADGIALICAATTISFALRTPAEQERVMGGACCL